MGEPGKGNGILKGCRLRRCLANVLTPPRAITALLKYYRKEG